ncbi:2-oxoacid:acceptor oxidoreductase family protein [Clostridium felsineum]|uniref:2-oxoacid:acceptor oxidoreductase family protein n=1 Tax=Clostridium felsineum TaxID=36839 RepID=UPI0009C5AFC7|nr:2-oxoacid:acceptor oxidoreductase family protein [Clostridium felsineum]URZ03588.1 NADH-dependent phenylglyoxylate dehydrogenase subunit gamma [Clostridium felsineum]
MKQIQLCGSGGQGIITTAIILGEAAVMEGKEVVQYQSYGAEARGGNCKSEVIISKVFINHPKIIKPDIVIALTQKAADKYFSELKGQGILIIDEDLVSKEPKHPNIIKAPLTRLAIDKFGKSLYTNIIMLGLLVRVTKIVSFKTIKKAVAMKVPKSTIEKNLKALEIGYNYNIDINEKTVNYKEVQTVG